MFNDETLSAYLDGELDETKRADVEAWLAADAGAAARLERMAANDAMLRRALPRLAAPASDPLAHMIESGATGAPAPRGRTRWLNQAAALAAACVLGVFAGQLLTSTREPSGLSSAMQRVLDTAQTGSTTEIGNQQVQIAVSFQTPDNRYCRQFRTTEGNARTDILACRDAEGWTLIVQAATPNDELSSYQAAGAEETPIDAAISALGGAAVLDADEEQRLIERNWR